MNKIILCGWMVENPKKVDTKSGESMTRFRISVKKRGKIREGEMKYNYFNCVAFKHTADYIYKYANSQSRIAVCGSLDNQAYSGKDGSKRYSTQVLVDEAEIVSSTVNQGDFQEQGDPLEQYQGQDGGGFMEVDEPDLPFI